jgi:hypothetical protein
MKVVLVFAVIFWWFRGVRYKQYPGSPALGWRECTLGGPSFGTSYTRYTYMRRYYYSFSVYKEGNEGQENFVELKISVPKS